MGVPYLTGQRGWRQACYTPVMDVIEPIFLDRQASGVLDWLARADEHGRAVFQIMTQEALPVQIARQPAWLMRQLRTLEDDGFGFFFIPLTRRKPLLHCRAMTQQPTASGRYHLVDVELSVAQLLGLPNDNPSQELDGMQQFFQWARDKAFEATGDALRGPRLQWYRSGYGRAGSNYGLDWCGVPDGEDRAQWTAQLQEWRQEPWFERWHHDNLEALKKWRCGPHCWVNLPCFESEQALLCARLNPAPASMRP